MARDPAQERLAGELLRAIQDAASLALGDLDSGTGPAIAALAA